MTSSKNNKKTKLISWKDTSIICYLYEFIFNYIEEQKKDPKNIQNENLNIRLNLMEIGNKFVEKGEGKDLKGQRKTHIYNTVNNYAKYFFREQKDSFVGFDIAPYFHDNSYININSCLFFIILYEVMNGNLFHDESLNCFSALFLSNLYKDKMECEDVNKFISLLVAQVITDNNYEKVNNAYKNIIIESYSLFEKDIDEIINKSYSLKEKILNLNNMLNQLYNEINPRKGFIQEYINKIKLDNKYNIIDKDKIDDICNNIDKDKIDDICNNIDKEKIDDMSFNKSIYMNEKTYVEFYINCLEKILHNILYVLLEGVNKGIYDEKSYYEIVNNFANNIRNFKVSDVYEEVLDALVDFYTFFVYKYYNKIYDTKINVLKATKPFIKKDFQIDAVKQILSIIKEKGEIILTPDNYEEFFTLLLKIGGTTVKKHDTSYIISQMNDKEYKLYNLEALQNTIKLMGFIGENNDSHKTLTYYIKFFLEFDNIIANTIFQNGKNDDKFFHNCNFMVCYTRIQALYKYIIDYINTEIAQIL